MMIASVRRPGAGLAACLLLCSGAALAQTTDPAAAPAAAEPAAAAAAAPAAPAAPPAGVECAEIELFKASEEKVEGQTDRAAAIPQRNLEIIRERMIAHLPGELRGIRAVAAGVEACPVPERAVVVSGDILDFRRGNMALRYFVGFGAGAQKVRVRMSVKAKVDGAPLGEREIADTKWAGAFGGTNTKGLDDFAEKAAEATAVVVKPLLQKGK